MHELTSIESVSASSKRAQAHRHRVFAIVWFGLVPSLVTVVAIWLSRLGPAPSEAKPLDRIEAWLRDQPILVGSIAFVVYSIVLREFSDSLPPASLRGTARIPAAKPLSVTAFLSASLPVVVAVALALTLRSFVCELSKVRGASMLPTLYPGDLLLVNKLAGRGAAPKRGDPILLETPDPHIREIEPQLFKRVVGLPGDTLRVEGGSPIINGWKVPRCRIGQGQALPHSADAAWHPVLFVEWLGDATYLVQLEGTAEPMGPYTVKPGEVWVLGDNRNSSIDSRNWFSGAGGGVPFGSIVGEPAWTLLNTIGFSARSLRRTELVRLPAEASELSSALALCLAQKPKITSPPPPAQTRSPQ